MLDILAAWTGYRRQELASLTRSAFRLSSNPPTVTVTAAYSKRRRQGVIPLHPEVADRLKSWLATRADLAAAEEGLELALDFQGKTYILAFAGDSRGIIRPEQP